MNKLRNGRLKFQTLLCGNSGHELCQSPIFLTRVSVHEVTHLYARCCKCVAVIKILAAAWG